MIPKIAHFHWTGGPMSWLRTVSIASFKKFNPDWEIRLHDTHPHVKQYGLRYCQQADWTWWKALGEYGGFQVATDIVFVRPVPDDWLSCDMNACTRETSAVYQFAMMGAIAGHPYIVEADRRCQEMAEGAHAFHELDQLMGIDMLRTIHPELLRSGRFFDQPMGALCRFSPYDVNALWNSGDISLEPNVIGVHWYGGHPRSKAEEPIAMPGHPSFLVKLAQRVFP